MRKIFSTFPVNCVLFLFFLVILACNTGSNNNSNGPSPGDNTIDPPQGKRDKLTAANLLNDPFTQVIHYDYFLPIGETKEGAVPYFITLRFAFFVTK